MTKKPRHLSSDRAELLIDQAMDASTDAKAKQLIVEAVTIDPECVDGWNLLADFAETPEEALALYQHGVTVGGKQLGADFKKLNGHFWMAVETRPFMRALEGQARTHQSMGQWPEAIAVWETMIELNPNDNQGMRWNLVEALLFTEENQKAATLIDTTFPDDAYALWGWSRWLLAFRNRDKDDRLKELMYYAHENNEFVAQMLLDDRPLPVDLPTEMVFGHESEALHVVRGFLPAFTSTPGARTWLRKAAVELGLNQSPDPADLVENRVRMLGDAMETEQMASRTWMVQHRKFKFEGKPVWTVLIVEADPISVRRCEMLDYSPKPDDILDILLNTMLQPGDKTPCRPVAIQFSQKSQVKALAKRLDRLQIHCEYSELSEMDEAFESFRLNLSQNPKNLPRNQDASAEAELHEEMIWQTGMFRLPNVIEEKGVRTRPWGVLIADKTSGLILGFELAMELPDSETFRHLIDRTIQNNPLGHPILPGLIEVRTNDEFVAIQQIAKSLSIPVVVNSKTGPLDEAVNEFKKRFSESVMPSTNEIRGLSLTDRTFFYSSAYEFYKAKPWTRTRPDAVFQVNISENEKLFAITMGQLGSVIGLAIFTDVKGVATLFNEHEPGSRSTKRKKPDAIGRSWSVLFGEASEVSQQESDAIDMLGLPVAGPEAYPELAEIVKGRPVALKNASDVLLTAICLSAFARAPLGKSDSLSVAVSIPDESESTAVRVVHVTLETIEI